MYVFNSLPYPSYLLPDSFPSPSNPQPRRQELSCLHFNPLSDSHLTCCVTRGVKMSSPSKRRDMDVMKLMMGDYKVEMVNDSMSEFFVEFKGPAESLYEGGVWRVRVELPEAYPYKSPSIGFVNRIYHPNIDEISGSVCLNVINQTWSPMFDLVNIFEVFLPQLLLYPNPSDPLNGEAASLMVRNSSSYEQSVKEHCARYAKPEDIQSPQVEEEEDDDDESESEDDKSCSSSEDEMEVEGI